MSASGAIIGKGTTLSYSTTSGGTYTVLAEVVECPFPDIEMDFSDVTHYTSDNATIEEIPSGWTKPGEMPITLNYLKAGTTLIVGTLYGTPYWWKLTLPDASVFAGKGTVRKIGGTIPMKEAIRTQITLKQQGQWTFAAGA